jgi:hypothetical protein
MFVAGEALVARRRRTTGSPVVAARNGRPMPRERTQKSRERNGAAAPAGLELQLGEGAWWVAHGPTAWRPARAEGSERRRWVAASRGGRMETGR